MSNIIKKSIMGDSADVFIDRSIGTGIDEISARQFEKELSEINPDAELNVFFDSSGGNVSDGKKIHTAICLHKGRTTAHVQGIAASISSVIALACDEVFISADALMMVHDPVWSASRSEALCSVGNQKMITIPRQFKKQMPITIPTLVKDKNASVRRTLEANRHIIKKHRNLLKGRKKLLAESKEYILNVYTRRSGANRQDLIEMMQAETWFTASDCMDFGFCDGVSAPAFLVDHVDFTQFSNPTNFLASKYMDSAGTARASRRRKVNRKQVSHMQQRVQKILTQRQEA